jgi:hypothetical protein
MGIGALGQVGVPGTRQHQPVHRGGPGLLQAVPTRIGVLRWALSSCQGDAAQSCGKAASLFQLIPKTLKNLYQNDFVSASLEESASPLRMQGLFLWFGSS